MKATLNVRFDQALDTNTAYKGVRKLAEALRGLGVDACSVELADSVERKRFDFDEAGGLKVELSEDHASSIAVIIEGGMVQDIVSECPEHQGLPVFVIDYDTDGIPDDELVAVPQGGGGVSSANAYETAVGDSAIDLRVVEAALDQNEAA